MLARMGVKSVETNHYVKFNYAQLSVYIALIVLLVASTMLSDRFLTLNNIMNVLSRAVPLGIISLGQTLVIITAGIDMSVGATLSLVTVLIAGLINGQPDRVWPVFFLVLLIGLAVGLANGIVLCRLKVPAFITTLAMSSILHGFLFMYAKNPVGKVTDAISTLAWGRIGIIPLPIIIFVTLTLLFHYILTSTTIGRGLYATGANIQVAYLSGINTFIVRLFAYTVCSIMTVMAGLIVVGRMGVGDPLVGENYTLDSIAAVLIGGTSLFGGQGGVLGTVTGVLIMIFLNNIFNLTNTQPYWQWIIKGLIVIAVVAFYGNKK